MKYVYLYGYYLVNPLQMTDKARVRNLFLILLIFIIFFAISFLTNILGSINPNVSDSFSLSGTMTGLLPFSFFIAYGLMSIPSGMFVQRYGEKTALLLAWTIGFAGSVIFSLFPSFPMFIFSLFFIGSGMAMLQVTIYPLLRTAGGGEHFSFNSVIAQLVFGIASFISPFVYSYLVTHLADGEPYSDFIIATVAKVIPRDLPWVSIYWIFALLGLVMILLVTATRFPAVKRKEDEIVGSWSIHLELFKQKTVIIFFLGIFAYVGVEQGIANWISEFLRTYHGVRPEIQGAATVGLFWGLMTAGCVLGLLLVKLMDGKMVLTIFTIASLIMIPLTLLGSSKMALFGFPALGFTISVMYALIFSLALNSVPKYHGSFSGILCSAIAGGALFSLLIGKLKDLIGLRAGMFVLLLPLSYILWLSIIADPLVKNSTIDVKSLNNKDKKS